MKFLMCGNYSDFYKDVTSSAAEKTVDTKIANLFYFRVILNWKLK